MFTAETDLQKIRYALKTLSESEKQLRVSKNQTTWLTVALLQLNSIDPSFSDPNESRLSVRTANSEGWFCFLIVDKSCLLHWSATLSHGDYWPNIQIASAADGDCCSTSSLGEKSKHLVSYDCAADDELRKMVAQGDCGGALESIWIRATEICQSNSLRIFLRRRGKLSSVWVKKGKIQHLLIISLTVSKSG